MATFLPDDVIFFEILTRLPAKSLMRFKCVSKIWKTLISGDPYFINAYQRRHNSEDNPLVIIRYNEKVDEDEDEEVEDVEDEDEDEDEYEEPTPGPQRAKLLSDQCSKASEVDISDLVKVYGPVRFTSSCEGLICVRCEELPERVVLWNPATQQRRQLPRPSDDSELRCVAIGLDDWSGDWKVVRLCLDQPNIDLPYEVWVRAHVFVKSSATWRDCGASGIRGDLLCGGHPVAAAGALHWSWRVESRGVLSFDLDTEVLRISKGPPDCKRFSLCKWRSSLAALTYNINAEGYETSGYLTVSSPSSDGGGFTWNKLLKFTPGLFEMYRYIWNEQFRIVDMHPYFRMALTDPKEPDRVRELKEFRIDFQGGCWDFREYLITIKSVF